MLLLFLALVPCGFAAMCNNAPWSDNDRNGIVNAHNELRSKIARGVYVARGTKKAPAAYMIKMSYDCSMEASAQKWANTCPNGHSPQSPYGGYGENLYYYATTDDGPINITGHGVLASKAWEQEFQDFGWPRGVMSTDLARLGIGHATQMAWATSGRIGCGVKQCPSTKMAGYRTQLTVVCQYILRGNILTTNIYPEGTTCSACPYGLSCERSTGLCV